MYVNHVLSENGDVELWRFSLASEQSLGSRFDLEEKRPTRTRQYAQKRVREEERVRNTTLNNSEGAAPSNAARAAEF